MSELVLIDGAYGEGGGQVLRTSVALAAVTGRPIEIRNIRGNRSKPGLQAQHVASVKAAAAICDAEVFGDTPQSMFLRFVPRSAVRAGEYRFDIGTAGATSLVLQTVFAALASTGERSRVVVTGGTHNPMAPPADYLQEIFLPALQHMGISSSLDVPRFGFFPKGGGELTCEFEGALRGVELRERGELVARSARVITHALPEDVAKRGAERLRDFVPEGLKIENVDRPALGAGAAVFVGERYKNGFGGFSGIGERGKRMELVAEEAGAPFAHWRAGEATVDEHLADQLVLPAVLAKGASYWRTNVVTEHLRTVAWLVREFLDREIEVRENGEVAVA